VRDKMIATVEGFAKSKITDEELARFKAKSKKQFKQFFANSTQLGILISEFVAAGDWRLVFQHRDQVAALTIADVQKAAAAYLLASNRTLGLFQPVKAPERAPQKETPDIAKVLAGYKGAPLEAEGEKFDATPENIDQRTTRATLAGGMKLAILAKQTRGRIVRAKLSLRYGSEADFTGTANRVASMMLGGMLARGSKQHTFQQLQDQWDLLEAQVSFTSPLPGRVDVSVQTTRDHFAAVLALVDEVLRRPALPQDQLDIVVKETLTSLDDQKSDPQAQAFVAVRRALAPYPATHPLYVPTVDESIAEVKALRLAELRKLAAMLGTSNAQLTILGDVDTQAIRPWVEATWGTWKSPRPWKRLERKYAATAAADQALDFPDKANALIATAVMIDLKDDDADVPAMAAADFTLGGGGFVSRLVTRLREKDGLSYFAFSALQLVPFDAAGSWFTAAGVNPQNARKGMAEMTEEITNLMSSGLTAAELAVAKKGMVADFERNLSNDNFVIDKIQDGLYTDRTMAFWAKRNAAITALTLDQVNAAIKRHVKPGALVKIISGDQKKMTTSGDPKDQKGNQKKL
jgi:zinc protease